MGRHSDATKLKDAVAWHLGVRPMATFVLAAVLMLLAGALPIHWAAQHPFVRSLLEDTLRKPYEPPSRLQPVSDDAQATIPDAPLDVSPLPEPEALETVDIPEPKTETPPPPREATPPRETSPPVDVSPPSENARPIEAVPPTQASAPAAETTISVPPQRQPEVATEAAPLPPPKTRPEVIEVPMPPPATTDLASEADEAIRGAITAAAAAVARFASENRTAVRNAEYIAGDEALNHAQKLHRAAQFKEAREKAMEARKQFERAEPEPWENSPIVIRK